MSPLGQENAASQSFSRRRGPRKAQIRRWSHGLEPLQGARQRRQRFSLLPKDSGREKHGAKSAVRYTRNGFLPPILHYRKMATGPLRRSLQNTSSSSFPEICAHQRLQKTHRVAPSATAATRLKAQTGTRRTPRQSQHGLEAQHSTRRTLSSSFGYQTYTLGTAAPTQPGVEGTIGHGKGKEKGRGHGQRPREVQP